MRRGCISPGPAQRPLRRPILTALSGLAALAIGCHSGAVPTGPGRVPGAEPTVSVGLAVDSPSVVVSATAPFELVAPDGTTAPGEAGERWTVRADAAGRLTATANGKSFGPAASPLTVRVRDDAGQVTVAGKPYRGSALVRATPDGNVTAVNVLELENYLLGVVAGEIGRRPPAEVEAVKAQAVAARTYAIGNLGKGRQRGFDFYATVQDQVYGGVQAEDSVAARAVRETRGEIVTYRGKPILAYYHSTCGGRTAAIEDEWPWREPLPYLRSESDRIPGTDRSYCDTSSRFRWTVSWTPEQLLETLRTTLVAYAGAAASAVRSIRSVTVLGRSPSGRVATLRIATDAGDFDVRADSLRWVLRPPPGSALLNSSMLLDVAAGDSTGAALTVHGAGWGHGIGMCQVGAMGRARAGQSYRQILAAYYRDTDVQRMY